MLINPFNAGNVAVGSNAPNNRAQIEKSVSSSKETSRAADHVSGESTAASLQNQVSGLRLALQGTSELTSFAQQAEGGATQIQELVVQLQEIATEASSETLNDGDRQALNQQFQEAVAQIDHIANNTQFDGRQLLDGSVSGDNALNVGAALGKNNAAESDNFSIESLAATSLLGNGTNVTTKEAATQALSVIQQALNNVATTIAGIGSFEEQVEFTSAFLETAIANEGAASFKLIRGRSCWC